MSNTLIEKAFAQCKESLLHLRNNPCETRFPECFLNGYTAGISVSGEGSLSLHGWVKEDKCINIFYILHLDNSEAKYVNGEKA